MNALTRINQLRAAMPPDMRERIDAVHAELNQTWRPIEERYCGSQPGRVLDESEWPAELQAPEGREVRTSRTIGKITGMPGVEPRNPDPISEMTCGERNFGKGICVNCGGEFQKTGTGHKVCSPKCAREVRAEYARKYRKPQGDPATCQHKWNSVSSVRYRCRICRSTKLKSVVDHGDKRRMTATERAGMEAK